MREAGPSAPLPEAHRPLMPRCARVACRLRSPEHDRPQSAAARMVRNRWVLAGTRFGGRGSWMPGSSQTGLKPDGCWTCGTSKACGKSATPRPLPLSGGLDEGSSSADRAAGVCVRQGGCSRGRTRCAAGTRHPSRLGSSRCPGTRSRRPPDPRQSRWLLATPSLPHGNRLSEVPLSNAAGFVGAE